MTRRSLQDKDDFEHSSVTTRVDLVGDSLVNRALIAMAQEVTELLKQAYPTQADSSDRTPYNCHLSQNSIKLFDSEI
jgi:hypothetical protein